MTTESYEALLAWLVSHDAVDPETTPEALAGLKRLDLSGRGIETLPETLGILGGLITLNLANNRIQSLPHSMVALQDLVNLDLRRNAFEVLPECLGALGLKSLNASGNRIADIGVLARCADLRVLDLSGNVLKSVGTVFRSMTGLRNLNLSLNFLENSDGMFEGLEGLEILMLNHNLFERLDHTFSPLESLERLELSDNRIRVIDEVFYTLPLEYLDLSSNALRAPVLKGLGDLEELILDDNDLSAAVIEADFAPHLLSFSCEGCHLQQCLLPPSPSVEVLAFPSNSIREIPDVLSAYTALRELDLDNNEITEIPGFFPSLKALETLYIDSNPLSDAARAVLATLKFGTCNVSLQEEIVVTEADAGDLEAMAGLLEQLFAIESDFVADREKQIRGLALLREQESANLLVARRAETVVGMVTMQRLVSSAEGGYIGQVEDLIVDAAYRQLGIGQRLISEVRRIAEAGGYLRVQLAADMENAKALYFYRKRGFRKTQLTMYHLKKISDA